MKIALFIGNGFDIGLGLNTQYKQFYKHYLSVENSSETIRTWKKEISDNIELWSDLERRLREIAENLHPTNIPDFMEFVEDITEELSNYLDIEDSKILSIQPVTLRKDFYYGLRVIHNKLKDVFPNLESNESAFNSKDFTILNFNYTSSIDHIIKKNDPQNPQIIHPHGDLYLGLVVGTKSYTLDLIQDLFSNDTIAMGHADELSTWTIKESIIKTSSAYKERLLSAENAIKTCDAICIYGMSLGESDSMWWLKIIDWLIEDPNHCLMILSHSVKNIKSRVPRRQYRNSGDSIKAEFIRIAADGSNYNTSLLYDEIESRITILSDEGIFNFNTVL